MEIGNFLGKICCCFKIEFEIKKLVDTLQTVAQQPGVPLCGRATVWWCSITLFYPFNLSLNLPKFHLNSRVPPP